MDLLEYQGKQLFARHGVPVPSGRPAETVDEAVTAADAIGYPCVVKAQVQIGGRGKLGGIKVAAGRDEAREHAYAKNLDLVEVAAQADPPVAKVMDYGKYKYEEEQKRKQARKHQSQIHVKEIKLRPKIGVHDYNTKKGHVERFLNQRAKVKVTIMFRGRETTHPERGRDLLLRLAEDVKEIGQIESQPLLDGRNMVMVLGPTKNAGMKREDAEDENIEQRQEAV